MLSTRWLRRTITVIAATAVAFALPAAPASAVPGYLEALDLTCTGMPGKHKVTVSGTIASLQPGTYTVKISGAKTWTAKVAANGAVKTSSKSKAWADDQNAVTLELFKSGQSGAVATKSTYTYCPKGVTGKVYFSSRSAKLSKAAKASLTALATKASQYNAEISELKVVGQVNVKKWNKTHKKVAKKRATVVRNYLKSELTRLGATNVNQAKITVSITKNAAGLGKSAKKRAKVRNATASIAYLPLPA